MKKLICALLALLMIGMMSVAMAEKPGDTITLTITITSTDGTSAGYVNFDASGAPVTCTSIKRNNQTDNDQVTVPQKGLTGRISVIGYMDPDTETTTVQTGTIATLTFKINDDAKPGRYSIKVWGTMAITGVNGGKSFTIEGCVEHVSDNGTVTKEATCTEAGSKVYKCTECGTIVKTEEIPVIAHNASDVKVTKEPTCTEPGIKSYACSMCGADQKTEEIAAIGHGEGEVKVTKPATCTEAGEKTYTCPKCQQVIKTEPISATGHSEGETKVTKEPTCTEKGEKSTLH